MQNMCLSGPTSEENTRMELTGTELGTKKKIHVFTLYRKRDGPSFEHVANIVFKRYTPSVDDPIRKSTLMALKNELFTPEG